MYRKLITWILREYAIWSITDADIIRINRSVFEGTSPTHKHLQKVILTFWFGE